MSIRLTNPQLRVLLELPADGSWLLNPGRLSSAIASLMRYHRGLVVEEWGNFGPRGGRCKRVRLTFDGVKEVARYRA